MRVNYNNAPVHKDLFSTIATSHSELLCTETYTAFIIEHRVYSSDYRQASLMRCALNDKLILN